MHDLTGPVVLLMGTAAGSLHLPSPGKPLIRTVIHTLICIPPATVIYSACV